MFAVDPKSNTCFGLHLSSSKIDLVGRGWVGLGWVGVYMKKQRKEGSLGHQGGGGGGPKAPMAPPPPSSVTSRFVKESFCLRVRSFRFCRFANVL